MNRMLFTLCGVLLISVFCCAVAWAQATAQISGTAKDQSGAVLPGVEVTVTQTETGIVRTTLTNETGTYIMPNLAVGPYRVEATLPGFRTYVQTGIVLQVNANPVINLVMEVGQVAEQIEVQANATLVETRNVGIGQVIENARILELPLNGRQVTDLIVLSGAAVQTGVATSRGMNGGVLVSVSGGQSWGVAYSLDGALHNNAYDNTNLPLPFPDALQEFKVETSALSAQSGMHSGASVNAVTKSGTNAFHGDAFEFVRNSLFNARNFFALKRDTLKRNQFGGTLGGPILKNRLFFFAGYQRTVTRSDPGDTVRYIPTPAMLLGDFTAFASAACNAKGKLNLPPPFVNDHIDPQLFSKPAVFIANKLPKTDDPCGKITFGLFQRPDEWQQVDKIDYQLGASHSIFGRFLGTSYKSPSSFGITDNILTTIQGNKDNIAKSLTLGDTYLIGPSTVNALRLAVNKSDVHRSNKEFLSFPDIGIKTYTYVPHYLLLSVGSGQQVSGGFGLGGLPGGAGAESEARFITKSYQIADDLNFIAGTHQISLGGSVTWWNSFHNANVRSPGQFNFDASQTGSTGSVLADFLLGKPSSFNQGTATLTRMAERYLGLYTQDTWKVKPRLTLNYGLRWEPWFPIHMTDGQIYNFDYDRFKQNIKSTVFQNAPAGLYYPGDPGFPGNTGTYKRWLGLEPRLGLAWDVTGDGRTSVRASYAKAYDFVNGQFYATSTATAPPWGSSITINSPSGGFEDPWRDYPGGNPFPVHFDKNALFTLQGAYSAQRYDVKTTSLNMWNLSIQRQISADWIVSANYIGSQTAHLWNSQTINPGIYFPGSAVNGVCMVDGYTFQATGTCSTSGNLQQRRRFSLEKPDDGKYYGAVSSYDDSGTATYHGLLLSAQRRVSRGVNINGNYTWSHCLSNPNGVGPGLGTGGGVNDIPTYRYFDGGNCDSDRRHNLNLTALAETPQFTNTTLRLLGSGWRLSGIYKVLSGSPLTITSGIDRTLTGIGSQRPNQVLGNPYGDKSLSKYLNPDAFQQPALGTLGNMSINNISGPSFWQLDMALSRVFQIRESQRLEFRAEAFNLTNSLRKGDPNTVLNNSTFGQINTSADARIMQFALKYVF